MSDPPSTAASRVIENDDTFRHILKQLDKPDLLNMLSVSKQVLPKALAEIYQEVPLEVVDKLDPENVSMIAHYIDFSSVVTKADTSRNSEGSTARL